MPSSLVTSMVMTKHVQYRAMIWYSIRRHGTMSFITLLHNPNAGSKRVTKEFLVSLISSAGYRCRYLSSRDNSHDLLDPDAEMLVIAGGDGTVRKVIRQMLVHQ